MKNENRLLIAFLLATGGLTQAAATSASDAPDVAPAVRACAAETDRERRLACFDAIAARLAPVAAPATPAKSPEERFGYRGEVAKEEMQRERERNASQDVRELRSKVKTVSRRPMTPLVVTLENGQVWAQREADSRFDVNEGDEVIVKAAALGSFLLVGPKGGSTRVYRVR